MTPTDHGLSLRCFGRVPLKILNILLPTQKMDHLITKGCAIDVGLYYIETGESVAMISGYDEFTERAYPNYMGGSKLQRDIRDNAYSSYGKK